MKAEVQLRLTYYAAVVSHDDSSLEQIRALHASGVGAFEMLDWEQKAVTLSAKVSCDETGQPIPEAIEAAQNYMLRHAKRMNAKPIYQPTFNLKLIES